MLPNLDLYTALKSAVNNNFCNFYRNYCRSSCSMPKVRSNYSSQASGANAIKAFFNLLNKKHKPVILLGPSTTSALEPIAEAAPKWKLVQV